MGTRVQIKPPQKRKSHRHIFPLPTTDNKQTHFQHKLHQKVSPVNIIFTTVLLCHVSSNWLPAIPLLQSSQVFLPRLCNCGIGKAASRTKVQWTSQNHLNSPLKVERASSSSVAPILTSPCRPVSPLATLALNWTGLCVCHCCGSSSMKRTVRFELRRL